MSRTMWKEKFDAGHSKIRGTTGRVVQECHVRGSQCSSMKASISSEMSPL